MPERRASLEGAAAGERLRIRELPPRPLVQVSAFHGHAGAAADALERSAGLRPPRDIGHVVERDDRTLLCVGPGRWWLVGGDDAVPELDPARAAVVDQSHGRVVLEVAGERVRDLLAKGTSIDLHPAALPAGRSAATALGPIAVVLHARADDRFEIHVARSYARALFDWLDDAALELDSGSGEAAAGS